MNENESTQNASSTEHTGFSSSNPTKEQSQHIKYSKIEAKKNNEIVDSKTNNNECKKEMNIINLHFFFDGTGNNKHNTKVRIDNTKNEHEKFNITAYDLFILGNNYYKNTLANYTDVLCDTEKKIREPKNNCFEKKLKPEKTGYYVDLSKEEEWKNEEKEKEQFKQNNYLNEYDDLSYYNYYSNIALLSDAINTSSNNHVFYIGGAGTISFEKDDQDGAGFAKGETGANEKIQQTLDALDNYLSTSLKKNKKYSQNIKISTININLYGFSRGAFYARYFYSELNKILSSNDSESQDNSSSIKYKNIKKQKYKIHLNLGIFLDTVSSEGYNHSNDVDEFNLDNTYDNMIIYHICAQDEFRYHFPLTSIKKCLEKNTKSIEIIIPGAHSDIGGGYQEICNEDDKDLNYARLTDNGTNNYGYVPFYWFVNKGYYKLDENGHFFPQNIAKDDNLVNGAITVKDGKVRCLKRKINCDYQFVTAKIMQKIMMDNFGANILKAESEFNKQIANLSNLVIKNHGDYIKNLDDYANKIISWMPNINTCYQNTSSNAPKLAKLQETNIFKPSEHGISESTMKYIYNNFIHNSLTNSTDDSSTEKTNSQKRAFYIAYHAQNNNYSSKKLAINENCLDLKEILNYIPIFKNYQASSVSMPLGAIEQEKIDILNSYDELFLGTYNYKLAIGAKIDDNLVQTANYKKGIFEQLYQNSSEKLCDDKSVFSQFNYIYIDRIEIIDYLKNNGSTLIDSTAAKCLVDKLVDITPSKYSKLL